MKLQSLFLKILKNAKKGHIAPKTKGLDFDICTES